MQQLTPLGQQIINDIAQRYNLSQDAVIHMLVAVSQGGGSMAQFNCYELGGSGQWMRGGMTMVGDMFNNGLKATVDNLCNELSNALAVNQMFPVAPAGTPNSNEWWPMDLGAPFSSGSQNNLRYAVFPQRLAVDNNGSVTVYNTLDHQIGGVSQQQGGNDSLMFTSQYGMISVNSLPIISGPGSQTPPVQTNFVAEPEPFVPAQQYVEPTPNFQPEPQPVQLGDSNEILTLLEKLGQLHSAGILSDDEFFAKKAELLNRL